MMLPKAPPGDFPRHLERIREMHCLVCWSPPPNEAAHIRMGLAGGMAKKPSDLFTVPLCHKCHAEQHAGDGEVAFWRDALATNKVLLTALLRAYARSLYQDEMVS
jgi:hypothetical protein